jgi:hypothetical protein
VYAGNEQGVSQGAFDAQMGYNSEQLLVEDAAGHQFTVQWTGFEDQGDHVKVWVLRPTGYQDQGASQTRYPHQYHKFRVSLFVILALAVFGLLCWMIETSRR